jgi:hypothetical protein
VTLARRGQGSEALTILYPDGEREFWLTHRNFAPGDVLKRNRSSWVVVRIDDGVGPNHSSTVVVMPKAAGGAEAA